MLAHPNVFVFREGEGEDAGEPGEGEGAVFYLQLGAVPGTLRAEVCGLDAPAASTLRALTRAWQSKLDESVAQLLGTLLARNPLLKLTRADLDFLMPPELSEPAAPQQQLQQQLREWRCDTLAWQVRGACAGVVAQWRLTLAQSAWPRVHTQQPSDAQLHVYNHVPSKTPPQPSAQPPSQLQLMPGLALVHARLGHGLALAQLLSDALADVPCAHTEEALDAAATASADADADADAVVAVAPSSALGGAAVVRVRVWTRDKLVHRVDALAAHLGHTLLHARLEHRLECVLAPTASLSATQQLSAAQRLTGALLALAAPSVRTVAWRVRVPAWDVHATLLELHATLCDATERDAVPLFLRTHPSAAYTAHALQSGDAARSRLEWADLSGHNASVTGAAQFVFVATSTTPSATLYEAGTALLLLHFSAFEVALA